MPELGVICGATNYKPWHSERRTGSSIYSELKAGAEAVEKR